MSWLQKLQVFYSHDCAKPQLLQSEWIYNRGNCKETNAFFGDDLSKFAMEMGFL